MGRCDVLGAQRVRLFWLAVTCLVLSCLWLQWMTRSAVSLTPIVHRMRDDAATSLITNYQRLLSLEQLFWILNSVDISVKCSNWADVPRACHGGKLSGAVQSDHSQGAQQDSSNSRRARRTLKRKASGSYASGKNVEDMWDAAGGDSTSDWKQRIDRQPVNITLVKSARSAVNRVKRSRIADIRVRLELRPRETREYRRVCFDWLAGASCRVMSYTAVECLDMERVLNQRGCRVHAFTATGDDSLSHITGIEVHKIGSREQRTLHSNGNTSPVWQDRDQIGWTDKLVHYMSVNAGENEGEWSVLTDLLTFKQNSKLGIKQLSIRLRIGDIQSSIYAPKNAANGSDGLLQQLPHVQQLCDTLTMLQLAGYRLVHSQMFGSCIRLEIGCLSEEYVTLWINPDLNV